MQTPATESRLEELLDLRVANLIIERDEAYDEYVVRSPSVNLILGRLGLSTGSYSIRTGGEKAEMRFSIDPNAMMLGFDADASTREVKEHILEFSTRGGYKLTGSHLAGYQLQQIISEMFQFDSAIYNALIGTRNAEVPDEYARWKSNAINLLRGDKLSGSASSGVTGSVLTRIGLLDPSHFWSSWEHLISEGGIPPFLQEQINRAQMLKDLHKEYFDRALRFGLVEPPRDRNRISFQNALLGIAFLASSPECQEIMSPKETNGPDGWKVVTRFLSECWQVLQRPNRYRIIGNLELFYKYFLTYIAGKLSTGDATTDYDTIVGAAEHDPGLMTFRIDFREEPVQHRWDTLVALDVWDLAVSQQISGARIDDDDITKLGDVLAHLEAEVSKTPNASVSLCTQICVDLLRSQTKDFIGKIAKYGSLLPVTVRYRTGLQVKNQVIIPVAQGNKLIGIFIGGSKEEERELRERLEKRQADLVTKALTVPITWQKYAEMKDAKEEKLRLVDREEGWRHQVMNRHLDLKRFIEIMRTTTSLDVYKKLAPKIVDAMVEEENVLNEYGDLVGQEDRDWIDLESLLEEVARSAQRSFTAHDALDRLSISFDREGSAYAKINTRRAPLREALKELTRNACDVVSKEATENTPGRVTLMCIPRPEQFSAVLKIINTGTNFRDINLTDNRDKSEVTTMDEWDTPSNILGKPRPHGLSHVWKWIKEDLSPNLETRLFRYINKQDQTTIVEIELTRKNDSLPLGISFAPGDLD